MDDFGSCTVWSTVIGVLVPLVSLVISRGCPGVNMVHLMWLWCPFVERHLLRCTGVIGGIGKRNFGACTIWDIGKVSMGILLVLAGSRCQ